MRIMRRFGLLLLGWLLPLAPFRANGAEQANKSEKAPAPAFAKLARGMTPEQVRKLVGPPKHITRQILYHRYREQWIYDAPVPARLTFDCLRGQNCQLISLL